MKTERRHDLETNELARHMAGWIEKCKPHASQIFGTAIVVFGILILASLWGGAQRLGEEAAWDDYAAAMNSGDDYLYNLQQVVQNQAHTGTEMQEWAKVTLADMQTAQATQRYLLDRSESESLIEEATIVYEDLISSAKLEELRNRARFGLGRLYELQDRLDEAQEMYDAVVGDYELVARARSEYLTKPEVQEALKWLANAELPKREPGGATGDKPSFEAELPSAGFDAQSLENILGLSGEGSDDRYGSSESAAEEGADKTEQRTFELDEVFLDEETAGKTEIEDASETIEVDLDQEPTTETEATEETAEP